MLTNERKPIIMPKAKPQTVIIDSNYKVEIEPYNHTLMRRNDNKKTGWDTMGYYSTMATALRAISRDNVLNGRDCNLNQYAEGVLARASELLCHKNP